jgi:hypothetical protein
MRAWIAFVALLLSVTASAQSTTPQPRNAEPFKDPITGREYATGYIGRDQVLIGVQYYKPSDRLRQAAPADYDARAVGLVTPIKNQGNCGSCWSFARTRAFETALIKAGHPKTIDLAEQDAVSNDSNSYGCNGGFMDGRFEVTYGVQKEDDCPYIARTRTSNCDGEKYAKANRWALLGESNRAPSIEDLKAGIYQYGTLFVTVAAGGGFSPNGNGEIRTCSSRSINHMVTLQGYKANDDILIGNSWGTGWGEDGYAWSTQGCNRLASSAGDAAGFFYVEGEGPQPQRLQLPIEVAAKKNADFAIEVPAVEGVKYKWSNGVEGPVMWLKARASTVYTLVATDASGAETSANLQVTVLQ